MEGTMKIEPIHQVTDRQPKPSHKKKPKPVKRSFASILKEIKEYSYPTDNPVERI